MPGRGIGDGIDIGDLTDYINRELSLQDIYLSDADIQEALRDLQDAAEGHVHFDEEQLIHKLRTKLNKDRDSGGAQGLYRSRTRFLVFCYTAKRLRSHNLAGAVLRFLVRESHEIANDELPLLTEWCLGLTQLQGLVDDDTLRTALHDIASRGPPLFEEWRRPAANMYRRFPLHDDDDVFDRHRARDQLQLLNPRHRHIRLDPVPAYRRRDYLDDQPYSHAALHLHLLAQRHDLHAIRLHQRFQDIRLDGLQYEVEDIHRHLF